MKTFVGPIPRQTSDIFKDLDYLKIDDYPRAYRKLIQEVFDMQRISKIESNYTKSVKRSGRIYTGFNIKSDINKLHIDNIRNLKPKAYWQGIYRINLALNNSNLHANDLKNLLKYLFSFIDLTCTVDQINLAVLANIKASLLSASLDKLLYKKYEHVTDNTISILTPEIERLWFIRSLNYKFLYQYMEHSKDILTSTILQITAKAQWGNNSGPSIPLPIISGKKLSEFIIDLCMSELDNANSTENALKILSAFSTFGENKYQRNIKIPYHHEKLYEAYKDKMPRKPYTKDINKRTIIEDISEIWDQGYWLNDEKQIRLGELLSGMIKKCQYPKNHLRLIFLSDIYFESDYERSIDALKTANTWLEPKDIINLLGEYLQINFLLKQKTEQIAWWINNKKFEDYPLSLLFRIMLGLAPINDSLIEFLMKRLSKGSKDFIPTIIDTVPEQMLYKIIDVAMNVDDECHRMTKKYLEKIQSPILDKIVFAHK